MTWFTWSDEDNSWCVVDGVRGVVGKFPGYSEALAYWRASRWPTTLPGAVAA